MLAWQTKHTCVCCLTKRGKSCQSDKRNKHGDKAHLPVCYPVLWCHWSCRLHKWNPTLKATLRSVLWLKLKTVTCKFSERLNQSRSVLVARVCLDTSLRRSVLLSRFEKQFLSTVSFLQVSVCWIVNCVLIVSRRLKQKINDAAHGV